MLKPNDYCKDALGVEYRVLGSNNGQLKLEDENGAIHFLPENMVTKFNYASELNKSLDDLKRAFENDPAFNPKS